MGWLSSAFYLLIVHFFKLERSFYSYVFWAVQASVLGMLLSFPVQGYAFYSILFSSIYMLLMYAFAVAVWRDLRQRANTVSKLFTKAALGLMAFSTLGVWGLAPIMVMGLKDSPFYFAAVQFFLHFQFNGWLVFALLGILFKLLENRGIPLALAAFRRFYYLLLASVVFTYALVYYWAMGQTVMLVINAVGIVLQIAAFVYLFKILKPASILQIKLPKTAQLLLKIALATLGLKIGLQSLSLLPYFADISLAIRHFTIGFIHLLMLATLSTFVLAIFSRFYHLHKQSVYILLAGILFSELLLFTEGLSLIVLLQSLPNFYTVLALASALIPVGLIGILLTFKKA